MRFTLKNDELSVVVSSHGGEVCSVTDRKSGREYLWQGVPEIWDEHSPLLFPFCGRLKNAEYRYQDKVYPMKLHGFLRESDLSAPAQTENTLTFTLTESEKTLACYPFRFALTLLYHLEGRTLSLSATVTNTGSEILPFAFGGHPGISVRTENGDFTKETVFHFAGDVSRAKVFPLVNGSFVSTCGKDFPLPGGNLTLGNDLFRAYDTVVLKDVPQTATLTQSDGLAVTVSRSENLPYFCLWKSTAEGAAYVCLEPWSGTPNDGFSDEILESRPGLCRLPAGKSETFTYSLTFSDRG